VSEHLPSKYETPVPPKNKNKLKIFKKTNLGYIARHYIK
jgi:hypothetical protein